MLDRLLKQLVVPDGTADANAILSALRPRLIGALNAVTSELVNETTGEGGEAAVRASGMAGTLLMSKSLTMLHDLTGPTTLNMPLSPASARGAPPLERSHVPAHVIKRDAIGIEPRAHHAAARKTVRALADLCLRAPRGSLGWGAALWSLTHRMMPIELLLDELTAVTRACATAFPPLGVRGLGVTQHAAAETPPEDLEPSIAREMERETAGAPLASHRPRGATPHAVSSERTFGMCARGACAGRRLWLEPTEGSGAGRSQQGVPFVGASAMGQWLSGATGQLTTARDLLSRQETVHARSARSAGCWPTGARRCFSRGCTGCRRW